MTETVGDDRKRAPAGPAALDLLPCSERSLALGEDLGATAPAQRGVLVIEQPGPWGRDALHESGLRPHAEALEAHASAAGFKLLVARRQTRRYAIERRSAWVAGMVPGSRFLERLELGDPRELLELDLRPDRPTGAGALADAPLLLACTHSTRDACCARRGLPLARALVAAGGHAWHSSHLGGHRFAATMAVLPHGLWLGRVAAGQATEVLATIGADRIPLAHLRGRAGAPAAVQAAEIALRSRHAIDGLDDVTVLEHAGDDVRLRASDGRTWQATAVHRPSGRVRAVSCGPDAKREDPGRWEVTLQAA